MLSRTLLIRVLYYRAYKYKLFLQPDNFCKQRNPLLKNHKEFHSSLVLNKLRRSVREKVKLNELTKKHNLPIVKVWKNMTVLELARATNCDPNDIISLLPEDAEIENVHPNSKIETPSIAIEVLKKLKMKCLIVREPGTSTKVAKEEDLDLDIPSNPEALVKRPPVVTIMGHVDHGKTTLLDALRNSFVVDQEFGGITQHIGAFSVEVRPGEKITFIDTPGHAAFSAMRARGAEVTDLVVLVIAADDGIMQQTIESIKIANKAGVNIIIAVNKIDKTNAKSVESIKDELLSEGIQVEDKGGNIQLVPISALKKINLDLLTDTILVEAEVMNLKADPTRPVKGTIIESKKDRRGVVATVIVKEGTLKKGKIIVAGKSHAKVRAMFDENGMLFNEAPPSTPAQILGWREVPSAGDEVFEVATEKEAIAIVKRREKTEMAKRQQANKSTIDAKLIKQQEQNRQDRLFIKTCSNLAERRKFLFERRKRYLDVKDAGPSIKVILKGDVHGTVEVLLDVLNSYEQDDECELSVVDASVGEITPNDVELAELFNAIIYAFNVDVHSNIQHEVKEKKIDIRYHNVLYKLIDDLKDELNSKIPPVDKEDVIGEGEVKQHFSITVKRREIPVAGCQCLSGNFKRESMFKIVRGDTVIHTGKLSSMKHHKSEVETIKQGVECGLMFESFSGEFKPGDKVICYNMIRVNRKTSWNPGF